MIAGISACLDWGFIVHIDLLFVDEDHRYQGIGRFLVEKVEGEAKTLGAGLAQTDTFDFQAKDFYLKQGYEIFGEIENSPRLGHKRFYLKKHYNCMLSDLKLQVKSIDRLKKAIAY